MKKTRFNRLFKTRLKVPNTQMPLKPVQHRVLSKAIAYANLNGKPYFHWGKDYQQLRTPRQWAYWKKLYRVLLKYYVVEDNREVFNLDEHSFLSLGLSKFDYQVLIRGLEQNNRSFEEHGIKAVAKINQVWRSSIEEILRKIDGKHNN